MKKQIALIVVVATLVCCSVSNASITNAWWHDDGDGQIVCTNWAFSGGGTSSGTLTMVGTQYGNPGHMLGWVDTTDNIDPTLTLGNSVNNDSGVTWLGYQVNFIMSVPFTFASPNATADNPPNSDWYLANTSYPAYQNSGPYAGEYEGSLFFNAGTPINTGGELDYTYSVHFSGSTHYTFTEEAFAYITSVPEPSALVLVGMGGLMLARRMRRSRPS